MPASESAVPGAEPDIQLTKDPSKFLAAQIAAADAEAMVQHAPLSRKSIRFKDRTD